MQNPKRSPNRPRFTYAREVANQLLIELGICRFPINPFDIVNDLEDEVLCLSWSELHANTSMEDPLSLHQLRTDARMIWSPKHGQYLLVYDDTQPNKLRVRWTIMHELGHMMLGHLTDFPEASIGSHDLTEGQYGVLEVEANFFAAEVLCPTAVFRHYQYAFPHSPAFIHDLCLVSKEAAMKKFQSLEKNCRYKSLSRYDNYLIRNFGYFFDFDLNKAMYENQKMTTPPEQWMYRKCPDCGYHFSDPSYTYCPQCGYKLDGSEGPAKHEESVEIPRFVFRPGSNTQAFCPVCLNSDIHPGDTKCSRCHSSLVNTCLREKRPVPPEAAFCPYCGNPTSYLHLYDMAEQNMHVVTTTGYLYSHNDEWIEYPYWYFMKSQVKDPRARSFLYYSKAYTDDDDKLYVILFSGDCLNGIEDYQDPLEDIIHKYDPSIQEVEYRIPLPDII